MKINSSNIFESIKRQITFNNFRNAIQLLEFVGKISKENYSSQIFTIRSDIEEI